MANEIKQAAEKARKKAAVPQVSAVLDDGTLVEMLYRPDEHRTAFAVWQGGAWREERSILVNAHRLVPYSPRNNLLLNEVVLFPSEPEEYGSEEALISEIQTFIHRYVQMSSLYERIASYYVLLSWVYDRFNELPYLRLRGDPGSGKTRFLLTVGSLCYKPIFASGASTVSPLFRILDAMRGTLIIDEGDFRFSDEQAEIVKILNNGNARGFPVLRSEAISGNRQEYSPRAYAVFGPKLVATRGYFKDKALESRCLTEEMGQYRLREDVPINLPATHKDEALRLRNKLLLFRFQTYHRRGVGENLVDRTIEPRLNQVFVPLLSIIEDSQARKDLRELARDYNRELIADRGMDVEAQVLEIIRDIQKSGGRLSVKEITSWLTDRYGDDYDRRITPRWVGSVLRRRLLLKTQKSRGTYVIPPYEQQKLNLLFERYGITDKEEEGEEPTQPVG